MGTLQQEKFELGWTPNASEKNGNPHGLLRADNLVFDEEGVVGLSRGARRISSGPFANVPNALYSRTLDGGYKLRYVSEGGNVARNAPAYDPADFAVSVLTGGDASSATFGSAWGHTIVLSGTKKRLDNGTTIQDLALVNSTAPTVAQNAPPTSNPATGALEFAPTNWNPVEAPLPLLAAANFAADVNYTKIKVSDTTFRAVAQCPALVSSTPWDTTDFGGGTGKDSPLDLFQMDCRIPDLDKLVKVRIELILDQQGLYPASLVPDSKDYYFHEWYNEKILDTNPNYFDPDVFKYQDTAEFIERVKNNLEPGIQFANYFREGVNFWGVIQCLRSQFKRVGTDDSLGWSAIKVLRVIFVATEGEQVFYFFNLKFIGGETGQLTGYYSYLQVNCYDSGNFIQRSPSSPASAELQLIKANATVTGAAVAGNVNRVEIYRSSTQTPGYYLIKTLTSGYTTPFTDSKSDIDALRDNIPLEYYRTTVPDNLQYTIGPYFQRMIYFDNKSMYPSYRYDPGSYDSRHSLLICSASGETILWVTSVIDGVILVGTSHDIYQVRGDFAYNESTNLLDVSVESLGIKQVPVSSAVTSYGTQVIYLAEDGWRSIAGSTTYSMVGAIDRLYRGHTCHGISPISLGSNNYRVSSATVSKGRLICSVDESDAGRALHVFDLERKTWSYWNNIGTNANNPMYLFTEEDGVVIFSNAGDKYAYEWDYGTSFGDGLNLSFRLRTTYNHNNQPASRKDPLVLQITADSGNANVTITVRATYNTKTVSTLSFTSAFDGEQTKFFDISSGLGIPKYFQVEMADTASLTRFKLFRYSIDYVEHPPETNYLLIQPDNFGISGRKRMPSIPFLIDTQGNNVIVTPNIDGAAQAPSTINSSGKQMRFHHFTSDIVGYARGITLSCATGLFELYDIPSHKEIEVLPDPVKYKLVNSYNFGTTKRKRLVQFAFEIDTKGQPVTFTPYVDGVAKTPFNYTTYYKQTVIYFFPIDTIGIDVSATLMGGSEFEFYGMSQDQMVSEALPPATTFLHIPVTNLGSPSKKRVRTLPFEIDTHGTNVTFTPILDGGVQSSSTHNTTGKRTVFHYFASDVFPVDIEGTLSGANYFEFYGMSQNVIVERLPIGRVFDQIGPHEFSRQARVYGFRIQLLAEYTAITYTLFAEDTQMLVGTIAATVGKDKVYEVNFPKGVNLTVLRMELSSNLPFYRLRTQFKVDVTGSGTENKWVGL